MALPTFHPFIAFLMAATAASFSGWTFVGHPGLIWKVGLVYAFASFYVLTIPITGAFFAKRNWLMGKRYGFITPGDMFAYYYNNELVRWLTVLAALLYSIFYSGIQLIAASKLFFWVAGVPPTIGLIFMAFIVWFYVVTGGLKASTWVGVLQFLLLVGGIALLGFYVIKSEVIGGWVRYGGILTDHGPRIYYGHQRTDQFRHRRRMDSGDGLNLYVCPHGYSVITGVYSVELWY